MAPALPLCLESAGRDWFKDPRSSRDSQPRRRSLSEGPASRSLLGVSPWIKASLAGFVKVSVEAACAFGSEFDAGRAKDCGGAAEATLGMCPTLSEFGPEGPFILSRPPDERGCIAGTPLSRAAMPWLSSRAPLVRSSREGPRVAPGGVLPRLR